MKALILAAGRDAGIQAVHRDRPTCLIQFNKSSTTILDQQIESLFSVGVSTIGIVVGYELNQIVKHVCSRYEDCLRRFQFIVNPRFEHENDLYSLWLAREWLEQEPFICLRANLLICPQLLDAALGCNSPITTIVDPWPHPIGATIISSGVSRFLKTVDSIIRTSCSGSLDTAIEQLMSDGVPVVFSKAPGMTWAAINDPGDLAFARLYVFPRLKQLRCAA